MNSSRTNKTNASKMQESKSVEFQVTYIERKQDSFYHRVHNNSTNFLKSGNVTTD